MRTFTDGAHTRANNARATLPVQESSAQMLSYVSLCGATLAAITERECVDIIMRELDAGHGGWLMTLNLDHLRRAVLNPAYGSMVARTDLLVADGMPLIWASWLQRTPLPERVTGSNLIWSMSAEAAVRERSIFLLGGASDVAFRSAEILGATYPRLRVAGVYVPPHGFECDVLEMEKLIRAVCAARPEIVYVALGSPKEDALIEQLRARLPQAWFVGVGISFSWVAGVLPRAPLWMQQWGLEWLHRLWQEPRRLGRRYLLDDLPFAFQLFVHAWRARGARQ